jgi:hypothetical protein
MVKWFGPKIYNFAWVFLVLILVINSLIYDNIMFYSTA